MANSSRTLPRGSTTVSVKKQFERFREQLDDDELNGYPVEVLEDAVSVVCIADRRNNLKEEFELEFLKFLNKKIEGRPNDEELETRGIKPEELDRIDKYTEVFKEIYEHYVGKDGKERVSNGSKPLAAGSQFEKKRAKKKPLKMRSRSPDVKRKALPSG